MSEVVVTIKLTGSQYRRLVTELEYHQLDLNAKAKAAPLGQDRRTAEFQASALEALRAVIAS